MSNEKKTIPWGKLVKLFLEFLLAAVVAIFGSCTARSIRAGSVVVPSYFVALHLAFFKPGEFVRCNPPCVIDDMDCDFLESLDEARRLADVPFVLNSAYRSVEYEKLHGRSGTSSHCKGLAVDIKCLNPSTREKIVSGLIRAGFHRIGIYPRFVHVDGDDDLNYRDTGKPRAIWIAT